MEWKEIIEHYEKAKGYLWGSPDDDNWQRDDENGYYQLWIACHEAMNKEEKNHLAYARILFMMLTEQRRNFSDKKLLEEYADVFMREYQLAIEAGEPPTDKELDAATFEHDWLQYKVECTTNKGNNWEDSVKLIEGSGDLVDFSFYDSEPTMFKHEKDRAFLKLKYKNTIATFEFSEIYEIDIDCDPVKCNIKGFFCYPYFRDNMERIVFDIGQYKIICKHIRVVSVK